MRSTMPLGRRLTLMNLLVSGTVLLITLISFFAYDVWNYRNNLVRSLDTQARIIGANSVTALVFDDPNAAVHTLSAFQASQYVLSAAILKNDGTVFATYHKQNATIVTAPQLPPDMDEQHWINGTKILLLQAITLDGKRQGVVLLEYNAEQVVNRMERFGGLALLLVVGSIGAALLVARAFRKSVTDPIEVLANTARVVSRDKDYRLRVPVQESGPEIESLIGAFNDMLAQIQLRDAALGKARDELEMRVEDRTKQLVAINRELEAFSYTVSHDLRGPLEVINGYAHILKVEAGNHLAPSETECITQIQDASKRMAELIEDLLNLSRVSGTEMHWEMVDLSAMARKIVKQLQRSEPERKVEFVVGECLTASADARLMQIVLENLIGNAWKYTMGHESAKVEFGCENDAYYVRDDGAGFDPHHADRLFKPFQPLHANSEFPGTGIGLATVQRIIHRHGGEIWATGAVERGAAFYFRVGA